MSDIDCPLGQCDASSHGCPHTGSHTTRRAAMDSHAAEWDRDPLTTREQLWVVAAIIALAAVVTLPLVAAAWGWQ